MGSLLEGIRLVQIRFTVKGIEEAKKEFARFFGVEKPPIINSGECEVIKTQCCGEPALEAQCSTYFSYFGDLRVELIQPNETSSAWREQLEQHGEGLHHLALNVKGMQTNIERCGEWGMKLIRKGEYRRTDGRYSFPDASSSLKTVVELLERDE